MYNVQFSSPICQALRVPGSESLCSREWLLILYVVRETSAEFGLHANDIKFDMRNEDVYRNFMFNFSCVLVCTSCAIKYTHSNGKNVFKCNLKHKLGCRYISTYLRSELWT